MLETGKITLCWPNYIDTAALSGGSWEAELPIKHAANPTFAVRARSTDLDAASTQFSVAMARIRPVAAAALAAHNLSTDAEWRIYVYADAGQQELRYDSGWLRVWPALYQSTDLEWEYDTFWAGLPTAEDRDDFTALATHFFRVQVAACVRIEISDPGNPDGYVELGRAMVSDAWQPRFNASFGIQHGHEIATEFETAGDAAQTRYAEPKAPKRTVQLSLDHLSETEGVQRMLGLQRTQGLHRDLLYAYSIAPSPENWRRTFIGQLAQADPLTHPYHATHTTQLSIQEVL